MACTQNFLRPQMTDEKTGSGCQSIVYVSNRASDTVSVVNLTTGVNTTIPVGGNPGYLALDSARGRLYVVAGGDNTLDVVDTAKGEVVASIDNPTAPAASFGKPAINPTTGMVYVSANTNATDGNGKLAVIDPATDTITDLIDVAAGGSGAVAVNSATNQILYLGANQCTVIDGASNNVQSTANLGHYGTLNDIIASDSAVPRVVNISTGNKIYAFSYTSGGAFQVSVAKGQSERYGALAQSSISDPIYAIAGNRVDYFGPSDGSFALPEGDHAQIAADGITGKVFVATSDPANGQGSVTVYDSKTKTTTSFETADAYPYGVAAGTICSVSVTIHAKKAAIGGTPAAGQFTFYLYPAPQGGDGEEDGNDEA